MKMSASLVSTGTIVSSICYITYQLGQHRNPLNKTSTSYDIFYYQANARLPLEFFAMNPMKKINP